VGFTITRQTIPTQEEVSYNWWILLSAFGTGRTGRTGLGFTSSLRLQFPIAEILFCHSSRCDTVSYSATSSLLCPLWYLHLFRVLWRFHLDLLHNVSTQHIHEVLLDFFLLVKRWKRPSSTQQHHTILLFLPAGTMTIDGPLTHSRMTIYYCLGTFSARLEKHNVW